MDRAKALDKIQKCLALGKSPNEAEAAAGLRQAQKLMEMFDVSERELGAIGYKGEKVHVSIQAGKVVPVTLLAVIGLVSHAFGVRPVTGRSVRVSDPSWDVTYWGQEHRVMLATYSHVVITRAIDAAWKKHLKENPHIKGVHGARAGFYIGWIDAVKNTVEAFAKTDEDVRGTELAMQNQYGRTLTKSKISNQRLSGEAMDAGGSAADGFALHRPVNNERRKIEMAR